MKILRYLSGAVVAAAFLLFLSGAVYTIDETQQVVITQFGKPIGDPIQQAGLHLKMPFVQKANYFDQRILDWDGDPNQIPTLDKRNIWADTTARWKITDPLKFMQSVGNENGAFARLDDIIDAATRDAISSQNLVEAIRSSNTPMEQQGSPEEQKRDSALELDYAPLEKIRVGREKIMQDIIKRSATSVPKYGIEIVDVRIKRINYVAERSSARCLNA